MCKTKVAVCSDIRTKSSTQREHPVEFFNVKPWWYGKKPLGVKRLMLGCTYPGCKGAWANKLCNLTTIICGSSVGIFSHVTLLTPKILGMASRVLENLRTVIHYYIFYVINTSHSSGKYNYHFILY